MYLFSVCVCVCMCVSVHVDVCVHVCVPRCACGDQRTTYGDNLILFLQCAGTRV